jgi:hypothetical protein
VEATYALFNGFPAWLVSFRGLCVPVVGGPDQRELAASTCAGTELVVHIDAETGEVIEAFSYR